MEGLLEIPDWLGAAVAGSILAAFGYVAKLFLEWTEELMDKRRSRRARLVALYSMLQAGRAAFEIQMEHRGKLEHLIIKRDPVLSEKSEGYDKLFANAYPDMTDEERDLHTIIRAITENSLFPNNTLLLQWVREDDYFKGNMWRKGPLAELGKTLSILEAHLILWIAKYKTWLPDKPANCLVYLADEKEHGFGFPVKLQGIVENILSK